MHQRRLPSASPVGRESFGLPDRHLYLCFQNPLKLHPDMDALLEGIVLADPKALIVLLSDRHCQVAELLKRRFAARIAGAGERIVFLPRQSFGNYCRLLQLADVILDPLHYGTGSSCYDVFSFNQPMVTLPGEFMPGRVAQAFYRKMQVEDPIAASPADYVSKAVQVATDGDYRAHLKQRIAQASDVIFDELGAVREHERFFSEALSGG